MQSLPPLGGLKLQKEAGLVQGEKSSTSVGRISTDRLNPERRKGMTLASLQQIGESAECSLTGCVAHVWIDTILLLGFINNDGQ